MTTGAKDKDELEVTESQSLLHDASTEVARAGSSAPAGTSTANSKSESNYPSENQAPLDSTVVTEEKKKAGPVRIFFRVIAAALAAFIIPIVVLSVVLPAILGWVPLTVLSGSMKPTYPVGSLVISEPIDKEAASQLSTGDVITFMPYPDNPMLVTHRIISVATMTDGSKVYTTQGDNNDSPDPDPVGEHQVRAVAKYHVPYLGYVTSLLDGNQKSTGLTIVIVALGGYVAYQAVMIVRDRTKKRSNGDEARDGVTVEAGDESSAGNDQNAPGEVDAHPVRARSPKHVARRFGRHDDADDVREPEGGKHRA